MKVLCEFASCGPAYVRSGWMRVFQACGHEFVWWDPSEQSAFDAFSESSPDIFIGTTYGLDRAIHRCIQARPEMRAALFASAWGPLIDDMDPAKYPVVRTGEEEKLRMEALLKETGRPDYVFIHVSDKYLEPTMGGWRSIGITPVGIMNAADTFLYYPTQSKAEYACDAMMCGGYWPYKSRQLTSHVLPLCDRLHVRLYGNRPWPTPSYCGYLHDDEVRVAMCSAKVCLSASEPHSVDYNFDCITRPFSALACGTPCVSDRVEEFRECYEDGELWMADDARQYEGMVRYLLANPDEAAEMGRLGRARTLSSHTYFDRVAKMLYHMGLADEAQKVVEKKNELVR